MNKDNLKDKIKRNIIKLLFSGQRTFDIENMHFTNGRPVTVRNVIVAEDNDRILKLQLYRHRLKHNDIIEEAEILTLLKNAGAMCQPIIYSTGRDCLKRPYIIMEKIKNHVGIKLADVLLAILEQHKFGIFHADTKTDNVIFNGLIAKLIDYDQSQILEEIKDLNPKLSAMFFINRLAHFWKDENKLLDIGFGMEEVTNKCMSYFIGDAFDFEKTSLYQSFEPKPFYAIDEKYIKSEGEINIASWHGALNKIDFRENEKVLDVNPDTGALSRYLKRRGCDVTAYSKYDREIYATKITSNILGIKINIAKEINKNNFDTVFLLNDREIEYFSKYKGAKRIIFRQDNTIDYDVLPEFFDYGKYTITKQIKLDEKSDLIVLELDKPENQ